MRRSAVCAHCFCKCRWQCRGMDGNRLQLATRIRNRIDDRWDFHGDKDLGQRAPPLRVRSESSVALLSLGPPLQRTGWVSSGACCGHIGDQASRMYRGAAAPRGGFKHWYHTPLNVSLLFCFDALLGAQHGFKFGTEVLQNRAT